MDAAAAFEERRAALLAEQAPIGYHTAAARVRLTRAYIPYTY